VLRRKAFAELKDWKSQNGHHALLITGARQVGKTTLVREFARLHYQHFVEINLVDNRLAAKILDDAVNAKDMMRRISMLASEKLVSGETLIFIDEVQRSKEIVTTIKFLVEQGEYDFVLSGSLLGVELNDLRSVPVGFLRTIEMFPLDFEEFCWANGVSRDLTDLARECYEQRAPVPDYLHEHLLRLFHNYLIVGGMPHAVMAFVGAGNVQEVRRIQRDIRQLNRRDIAQYAKGDALLIKQIYDLVPSQLNQENKRFELKALNGHARFNRYENRFFWLIDAGVVLPCYQVSEPKYPLALAKTVNRFKLYSNDVGLLTSTYGKQELLALVEPKATVNYGSTFENVVAQALIARGFNLFYYSQRKFGEVDFVTETPDGRIRLIESKSGRGYRRHISLDKLLEVPGYSISEALVLCEGNVEVEGKLTYLPVYLMFCL
jgi:predicted AAA+ superfamily ATPase